METILIFKEKNRQEKVVRQTEREREREREKKAGGRRGRGANIFFKGMD
jgi:hypothetical protein